MIQAPTWTTPPRIGAGTRSQYPTRAAGAQSDRERVGQHGPRLTVCCSDQVRAARPLAMVCRCREWVDPSGRIGQERVLTASRSPFGPPHFRVWRGFKTYVGSPSRITFFTDSPDTRPRPLLPLILRGTDHRRLKMREGELGRFCVGNSQPRCTEKANCGTRKATSGRTSTRQARVPRPRSRRWT